uniref:Uncharacterized protein n=1 Tax=Cacopsylla melanoneura TaxID=428564 RepID=A0A8D8TDB5_9HEMI
MFSGEPELPKLQEVIEVTNGDQFNLHDNQNKCKAKNSPKTEDYKQNIPIIVHDVSDLKLQSGTKADISIKVALEIENTPHKDPIETENSKVNSDRGDGQVQRVQESKTDSISGTYVKPVGNDDTGKVGTSHVNNSQISPSLASAVQKC